METTFATIDLHSLADVSGGFDMKSLIGAVIGGVSGAVGGAVGNVGWQLGYF
jgi:hypothetical protein